MSEQEHEAPEMQTAFERTLLRSARADAPPPDSTEHAWLRFSGAMGAAALSAGTVHASSIATSGWARLLRLAPLKYLVIGALSGSALTAAWFQTHRIHAPPPAPAAPRTVNVDPSNAPATAAPVSSESAVTRPPSAPLTSAPKRTLSSNSAQPGAQKPLAAPAREARTTKLNAASSSTASSSTAASSAAPYSTLPAETAALDAARAANAAGKFPRALNLLQQFRQNFPNSVLRADAEVVTIQTLEAAGDHAQAARRGMQFLTEYPNDPHSAALKRLLR